MKRIGGMCCFQNMDGATKAMEVLEDAGYELNIRHDLIDIYSAAVFVEAWRNFPPDTDIDEDWAASAILRELNDFVFPFRGSADDVGVLAEGELMWPTETEME